MRIITIGLGLSLLLLGCAKESNVKTTAPSSFAAHSDGAASTSKGNDDAVDGASQVSVDPALRKLCDLPTSYFGFDSANVRTDSGKAFDALVACFTDGPARDHRLLIIGHADPRGEEHYNLALGQRRAGSVAMQLEARGMKNNRIETSSRGELDASGEDEPSWAKDRRVELALAD